MNLCQFSNDKGDFGFRRNGKISCTGLAAHPYEKEKAKKCKKCKNVQIGAAGDVPYNRNPSAIL
jgi:hypothetical protein